MAHIKQSVVNAAFLLLLLFRQKYPLTDLPGGITVSFLFVEFRSSLLLQKNHGFLWSVFYIE